MNMEEQNFQTVADVARAYLCCSCGACQAVCPVNAIDLKETPGGYLFPVIEGDLCTHCGQCLKCCAGIKVTDNPVSVLPRDPFEGNILDCRVGKATDTEVYERSQSGGALSAVVLSLIEAKKISGATLVALERKSPPRPSLRITGNRGDILQAQGSKYCPAPLLSLFRSIREADKPVAFVGLSCHVHGLYNLFEMFPDLRPKVELILGLVCDRILTFRAIDYLMRLGKISEGREVLFQYRSKELQGYPGDVRIDPGDGPAIFVSKKERIRIKDFYTPARCRLCFDKMNVLSDLTFSDPHGIQEVDRKGGESLIIARSAAGSEALSRVVDAGKLTLRDVRPHQVLTGQNIDKKREDFYGNCTQWLAMGKTLPKQAEAVYRKLEYATPDPVHRENINLALALDTFQSGDALYRHARKWLRKRRRVKKAKQILRPFFRKRT